MSADPPWIRGFENLYWFDGHDVHAAERLIPQQSRWGTTVMTLHHARKLTPFITKDGRRQVVLHDQQHRRHTVTIERLLKLGDAA
jgi:hypothetical protein